MHRKETVGSQGQVNKSKATEPHYNKTALYECNKDRSQLITIYSITRQNNITL